MAGLKICEKYAKNSRELITYELKKYGHVRKETVAELRDFNRYDSFWHDLHVQAFGELLGWVITGDAPAVRRNISTI